MPTSVNYVATVFQQIFPMSYIRLSNTGHPQKMKEKDMDKLSCGRHITSLKEVEDDRALPIWAMGINETGQV